MIKFFRKIRYDLMEKNKTGKYLKYAIGEIVLVVIGILIALSINTWNQNRLNKILEQELLSNLLNDVEADIQNLKYQDSVLALAVFSKLRLKYFIEGGEIPEDSIFYYLSLTGPTNLFNPTKITYDEMKNSGAFKVITSKEMRREIAILYRQYERVEDAEETYVNLQSISRNIRIEDFSTGSLSRIGTGYIRDRDQVLDQIKTNRRFINALDTNFSNGLSNTYNITLEKVEIFKSKLITYLNL
jgi:hypothetical protein